MGIEMSNQSRIGLFSSHDPIAFHPHVGRCDGFRSSCLFSYEQKNPLVKWEKLSCIECAVIPRCEPPGIHHHPPLINDLFS
jgi:hypothetical protein